MIQRQEHEPAAAKSDITVDQLPPELREHVLATYKAMGSMLENAASSLGTEVLKHLAIMNTAGLAGATALYSAANSGGAIGATRWFLAGLMASILSMFVAYLTSLCYIPRYHKRMLLILTNNAPITAMQPPWWLFVALGATWVIGIGSVVSFVMGLRGIV